jgi:hypothetical protein
LLKIVKKTEFCSNFNAFAANEGIILHTSNFFCELCDTNGTFSALPITEIRTFVFYTNFVKTIKKQKMAEISWHLRHIKKLSYKLQIFYVYFVPALAPFPHYPSSKIEKKVFFGPP